jgi:superfamily II DNA helicase RecQ
MTDTKSVVERLRRSATLVDNAGVFSNWGDAFREAADLIEQLEAALREIDTVARSDEHHARIAAIARAALEKSTT